MKRNMRRATLAGSALLALLLCGCAHDKADTPEILAPTQLPVQTVETLQTCATEYLTEQTLPVIISEPIVETEPVEDLTALGEFTITHYCACSKCCGKSEDDPAYGITATGTRATEGRTVAVDPRVIPYGSEIVVRFADGSEARLIAEDCGGAIKGNRLDVYMDSHEAALVEGVKTAEVYIVEGERT